MTPTIEDVLKKHGLQIGFRSTYDWDSIVAAMQEWASLTPSNEKYWRERCEAAEAVIEQTIYYHDRDFKQAEERWKHLKSTPIPLTPCVELEKEVERLKGLIEGLKREQIWSTYKPTADQEKYWQNYKTENNL